MGLSRFNPGDSSFFELLAAGHNAFSFRPVHSHSNQRGAIRGKGGQPWYMKSVEKSSAAHRGHSMPPTSSSTAQVRPQNQTETDNLRAPSMLGGSEATEHSMAATHSCGAPSPSCPSSLPSSRRRSTGLVSHSPKVLRSVQLSPRTLPWTVKVSTIRVTN